MFGRHSVVFIDKRVPEYRCIVAVPLTIFPSGKIVIGSSPPPGKIAI
jgi:hypothetical protein